MLIALSKSTSKRKESVESYCNQNGAIKNFNVHNEINKVRLIKKKQYSN